MKNALIIGFGLSGKSAARFLLSRGINVTAIDAKHQSLIHNPDVQELIGKGVRLIGEDPPFLTYDYVVCSPGIPKSHPVLKELNSQKIISEAELAFSYIKQPILGISGTNGKTTVTLLVAHICNYAGKKARALGNVGIALTSAIDTLAPDEIVVAELSSYQLEGLKEPILEASVLLNITPDHLDRYGTMEAYAEAKLQLHKITKDPGKFFMEEQCQKWLSNGNCYGYGCNYLSTDLKSLFLKGKYICKLPEELQNCKSHDVENFMAAFSLCLAIGIEPEKIIEAYPSFVKPHHRIEFVRELEGIKFFDDSKGTNIDAVIRAVERMQGPVHLIAGGVDKGASYSPWRDFQGKVKKIYAIGEAASKIYREINPIISVELYQDMEKAVQAANKEAFSGDNILLSPGCSSFDMFIDYVDRGKCFQKQVNKLSR